MFGTIIRGVLATIPAPPTTAAKAFRERLAPRQEVPGAAGGLRRMPAGATAYFRFDAIWAPSRTIVRPHVAHLREFLTSAPGKAAAPTSWATCSTSGSVRPRHPGAIRTLACCGNLRSWDRDHLLEPNHDFWLGPFLSRELGIVTHQDALDVSLQGRRIWLHHGDGLMGGDLGYKVLKRVLRNPVSIGLYRWIHPDLGFPLANRVSLASRHSRDARRLDGDRLWREIALPRFAAGYDAVMVGHLHHAFATRGRNVFLCSATDRWFTHVVLGNGELSMRVWSGRPA